MVLMIRSKTSGFAIPTILLVSTVMMALLLVGVQANTSVRAEINAQYYNSQARLAAQSGNIRAQQCLRDNGYVAQWTTLNPLKPNTDCSGNIVSTYSAYVYEGSSTSPPYFRTSFSVPPPSISNGTQNVSARGSVELLRSSNAIAWRTYSQDVLAQIGADISFSNVAFGYSGTGGAFFGTIDIKGEAKTLGYNVQGQLGTGNTTSSTEPRRFQLPANTKASRLYTNFLSVGRNMFAITTAGDVYGAGNNDLGQVGAGTGNFTNPITTPAKFILPGGVKGVSVAVLGLATFVIGDDHNVYASGGCGYGILGSNYTIAGCSNKSSYVRVDLPTPNVNDLNTIPVAVSSGVPDNNIVVDRLTAYIRMEGGAVYGWGYNDYGMLGAPNLEYSKPIRIGTYGDTGEPKATHLAFDGDTSYVRDDSGKVHAAGYSQLGGLGGGATRLNHVGTGLCINNALNFSSNYIPWRATVYTCVTPNVSERVEFSPYGEIVFRPNSDTTLCLDNQLWGTANGNPVNLYTCNGATAQKWELLDNKTIRNPASGKCLTNPGNNNTNNSPLSIYDCNASDSSQHWELMSSSRFTSIPNPSLTDTYTKSTPANEDKFTKVVTDQWSVILLTENGNVWAAGLNDRGQLGNGSNKRYNPKLTKMTLPSGQKAKDIYTTSTGINSDYANSFVVLENGEIWGCGSNVYGQLGVGSESPSVITPVKMNLPAGVLAKNVQVGLGTAVVLSTAGKVYTVGNNTHGQLGNGNNDPSSTPFANKYTNVIPITFY